jgi:hypothetical protein
VDQARQNNTECTEKAKATEHTEQELTALRAKSIQTLARSAMIFVSVRSVALAFSAHSVLFCLTGLPFVLTGSLSQARAHYHRPNAIALTDDAGRA